MNNQEKKVVKKHAKMYLEEGGILEEFAVPLFFALDEKYSLEKCESLLLDESELKNGKCKHVIASYLLNIGEELYEQELEWCTVCGAICFVEYAHGYVINKTKWRKPKGVKNGKD